jgi:hypothetical protein
VLARDGRHVEALAALDAALSDAQGADENVLQWLWDEADIIENDVQLRSGVDRRYSEESWREKPDARTVLAMARRAYARDSSNVVGLFTSKEVALQGQCSDCAVRSVSNNNSTKYLVEDMPYEQLRAFSAKVAKADVANRGMSHEELTQVMARLGLELSPRLRPTSEQELLDAVREANGVMASFAFKESVPDPTGDRWFRHAVAITGAFREGKAWRFVVKNSHFREPRLYSFAELRLWGLWIRSVEPSAALKARAGTLPLSRQESAMRWAQRRQAFDALAEEGLDVP